MEQLINVSSIDGRYNKYTKSLNELFSEYGLFKYRLYIEINYYIFLLKFLNIKCNHDKILKIYEDFNVEECLEIKAIELKINHDVKAVEYYIKQKFQELEILNCNYIHFGLTSQDINNTAISLSIKHYLTDFYYSKMEKILSILNSKSNEWKNIIMLSRTHGQSAVPTTLGKEIKVFSYRIEKQLKHLKHIKIYTKFGGAVGNLNAHEYAFPEYQWVDFCNNFITSIGLYKSEYTTQIDNYENLSEIFDNIKRINTILVDMCRDIWHYISINYFTQHVNIKEVGSSTMPHKINPINFENAEGNLMLSITLFEFLSRKLPISRLQRDLTDSTVLRNLGSVFGHCEIAYENIISGLIKIEPNKKTIDDDLNKNIVVLSEGIQTILRKHNYNNAYEKLKEFSRNNETITKEDLHNFIDNLEINGLVKIQLYNLTLKNYIGNSKMVE